MIMDDLKEYIINKIVTLGYSDIPMYVTDPDIARLVSSDEYFRFVLDRELSSRILEIDDAAVAAIDSLHNCFNVPTAVKVYEDLVFDFECFADFYKLVNFSVPITGEAMQTTYTRLLEFRKEIISLIILPQGFPPATVPDDDSLPF